MRTTKAHSITAYTNKQSTESITKHSVSSPAASAPCRVPTAHCCCCCTTCAHMLHASAACNVIATLTSTTAAHCMQHADYNHCTPCSVPTVHCPNHCRNTQHPPSTGVHARHQDSAALLVTLRISSHSWRAQHHKLPACSLHKCWASPQHSLLVHCTTTASALHLQQCSSNIPTALKTRKQLTACGTCVASINPCSPKAHLH